MALHHKTNCLKLCLSWYSKLVRLKFKNVCVISLKMNLSSSCTLTKLFTKTAGTLPKTVTVFVLSLVTLVGLPLKETKVVLSNYPR
jgi:hypothetical protein